jgi:hypothetical protein
MSSVIREQDRTPRQARDGLPLPLFGEDEGAVGGKADVPGSPPGPSGGI